MSGITPSRVAVYYAPAPDDPLFAEGATWLGRDPDSGAPASQPDLPRIAEVTAEPRHYGFHATLKPPMRLRAGTDWDQLVAATAALATGIAPFDLPPLGVTDIMGFLALRDTEPSMPLQALADLCIAALDRFREPLTEADRARRDRAGLTRAQAAMLDLWGYPYVFGTWFFHMTLTRRLRPEEKAIFMPAAERHLARALLEPRRVTDICLFAQPAPAEPFVIARRFPLRG